jgi:hypothetical protein
LLLPLLVYVPVNEFAPLAIVSVPKGWQLPPLLLLLLLPPLPMIANVALVALETNPTNALVPFALGFDGYETVPVPLNTVPGVVTAKLIVPDPFVESLIVPL